MEKIMNWWSNASKQKKIVALAVIAIVVIGIVQSISN